MGVLARIRSWFAPKPKPRPVLSDAMIASAPNEVVHSAVLARVMETGQTVSAHRPFLEPKPGETPEETHARTERELDAFAEIFGVDRVRS